MFSVLFTGFAVVLHKWSGAIDLAVGTPVAGRLRPEAEPLIGYFLNHLALRTDLSGDPTFRELLARVHAVAGGAFANQELPVREILGDACLRALYQVRFNFQSLDAPFSEPVERMGALALHRIKPPSLVTGMDVSLYLNEHPDHLALELRYKRDLFQAEAAAAALRGYLSVLAAAVEAPERRLASLCAFI